MKLTKETYYAIRIGGVRPYFKVGADLQTPQLFKRKTDAVACMVPGMGNKVVRVELMELNALRNLKTNWTRFTKTS